MSWKPEAIAFLTDCWNRGLTRGQIVREFAKIGVTLTPNAVIGKAHRLALKARPSPIRGHTLRRKPKPKPPRVIAVGDRICQWPIGHPGDKGFRFCDAPAVEGRPYCSDHWRKAHVRAPLKRLSP